MNKCPKPNLTNEQLNELTTNVCANIICDQLKDCQAVVQSIILELWDNANSDVELTSGSLIAKIKQSVLDKYQLELSDEQLQNIADVTNIKTELIKLENGKLDISKFFDELIKHIIEGNNITFDVDSIKQTITINSTGGGSGFSCNDLNSCKTLLTQIINETFYTKTETDTKLASKQDELMSSNEHDLIENKIIHTVEYNTSIKALIDSKQDEIVNNDEHIISAKSIIHSTKFDNSLASRFDAKQNRGYLDYSYSGGVQGRKWFQSYDLEDPITNFVDLRKKLDGLRLTRAHIIGSIVAYDNSEQTRYLTGTFTYTKLPNVIASLKIDLHTNFIDTSPRIGTWTDNRDLYGRWLEIQVNDPSSSTPTITFVKYGATEVETVAPFLCMSPNVSCSRVADMRILVISMFGNNNGQIPSLYKIFAPNKKDLKNGKTTNKV